MNNFTTETSFPLYAKIKDSVYLCYLSKNCTIEFKEGGFVGFFTRSWSYIPNEDAIQISNIEFIKANKEFLEMADLVNLFSDGFGLQKELNFINERISAFNNDILVSNIKSLEEENAELRKLLKRYL
jgi:hypothetical protein